MIPRANTRLMASILGFCSLAAKRCHCLFLDEV